MLRAALRGSQVTVARSVVRLQSQRMRASRLAPLAAAAADSPHPSTSSLPRVIIITGPTAVGKTKLSLRLAQLLDGEIISADSVQVYRGLDVGSDKLPPAQRCGLPHHLLDILDPTEEFSAGDFQLRGRAAIQDVLQRGKVPIVVGGTGFYLRWLIYGKATAPASNPETGAAVQALIDKAITAAADAAGVAPQELEPAARWAAATDLVAQLGDPASAQRVGAERNNWYRLQRVLQVLLQNGGRPLAEHDIDTTRPLDYDFRCFFLHSPRIPLYDRISERVEEMVVGGLLEEALMLLDAGLAPNTNMATKAIGYRQAMMWWQGLLQQPAPPAPAAGAAAAAAAEAQGDPMTGSRAQDVPQRQLVSEALKQRFQLPSASSQAAAAAAEQHAKRQKPCAQQPTQPAAAAVDGQAQGEQQQCMQQQAPLSSGDQLPAAPSPPATSRDSQQAPEVPQVMPAQVLQLATDVATASRNLVKSQYTYFRDEPLFAWVEASDPEAAFQQVMAALDQPHHAGNCGDHDSGRLDAAAQKALRLYQPRWQLLKQGEVMEGVRGWVNQVLQRRAAAGVAAATTEGTAPVAAAAAVDHSQVQHQ